MKKARKILMLLAVIGLTASTTLALELVTEARFDSVTGEPVKETVTFSGQGYENFVLKVINGDESGENHVASAIVSLNGVKILAPSDFNQNVQTLNRSIALQEADNVLSVNVRSNPGGYLIVQVLGEPTINLPPDPGPAGDETIEGIDTNENGIRDDVERWIGLSYRSSEKTRLALTQAYYPMQNFMIHAVEDDRDSVYNDMTALQRATECLYYIRRNDAHKLLGEIHSLIVNTSDRFSADREASRILGGGSFPSKPLSKWNRSCTFNTEELEN